MGPEQRICRLCLQIIGQDVPYSALINNAKALRNLGNISSHTMKNLVLTVEPVMCKSCDNKIEELSNFKETAIANESKIQSNYKGDFDSFLKTLSEDLEAICRVCLKSGEKNEVQKCWQDSDELFLLCSIQMNGNITVPAKICNACHSTLQNMTDFIWMCSENEELIEELAAEKEKLTANDLITASSSKLVTNIKIEVENDNNKLHNAESKSGVRRMRNKQQAQFTNRDPRKSSKTQYLMKNSNDRDPQGETSHDNKAQKTYRRRATSTKTLYSLELPSTSKAQLSTEDIARELILKQMDEQLEEMHISIDADPVSDLSDITFNISEEGFLQGEVGSSECDVTRELIDVLEDDLEADVGVQENNCDKEVVSIENATAGTSRNLSMNHSTQNTKSKAAEVLESSISIKEENLPNIKQIKRVLDMKLQNKAKTNNQADAEESRNTINGQNNSSITSSKKINRVVKKVNNKNKGNSNADGPPKKRAKKMVAEKTDKPAAMEIIPLPSNDTPVGPKENPDHISDDDDEFVEGGPDKLGNRPVTVTIIKGKKRTNKAQLDKTWQELISNPPIHNNSPSATATDVRPGLEIAVVKKKRGRPALPKHLKKEQTKSGITWLFCELCPFKTYTRNSFVQHQLIHNVMANAQTLRCDMCRFITSNPELMHQHKATHESVHLIYKCVFCDEIFKKKITCMYHTLRHDDQDVASQFYCLVYNGVTEEEHFECYQCDYRNAEESTMPDHVIDHTIQKPKNPIVAKFKCDLCQYRTKCEDRLRRHISLHESNAKPLRKTSQSQIKTEAMAIIKMEPGADNNEPEPEYIKCDQCHYMTRNQRSMSNHKGLKHRRNVHPVVKGKEATAKALAEDTPMYYCNECSYSTHRKLNLPRHALVHRTKENMELFECPHCLFETKHRRSYTRHLESIHAVIV